MNHTRPVFDPQGPVGELLEHAGPLKGDAVGEGSPALGAKPAFLEPAAKHGLLEKGGALGEGFRHGGELSSGGKAMTTKEKLDKAVATIRCNGRSFTTCFLAPPKRWEWFAAETERTLQEKHPPAATSEN